MVKNKKPPSSRVTALENIAHKRPDKDQHNNNLSVRTDPNSGEQATSCNEAGSLSALHDVHKAALQLYRVGIAAWVIASVGLIAPVLLLSSEVLFIAGLWPVWRFGL